MRIFINNYSLSKLSTCISSLKKYLIDTKTILEISSDEGEYYIDNLKVYKIHVDDEDAVIYTNYCADINLIVDYSRINLIETNQITNFNVELLYKYYYFALNKSSKIKFVIKSLDEVNIIPNDFYFEIEGEVEIDDLFVKNEIIGFLSMLN